MIGHDRLTTLPHELLAGVVAYLPARQICRLRQINKILKSFVDDNATSLTRYSVAYNRQRLHARLDNLLNIKHLLPSEAVARWVSYYGFQGFPDDLGELDEMCDYVAEHYYGEENPTRLRDLTMVYSFMKHFIDDWAIINLTGGKDVSGRQVPVTETEYLHTARSIKVGYTAEQVARMQAQVKDPKFFDGPHYTSALGRPAEETWVTRRTLPFEHRRNFTAYLKRLGVPRLPSNESLMYCARTAEMAALADRAKSQTKITLTPLQQAALLEELFIW